MEWHTWPSRRELPSLGILEGRTCGRGMSARPIGMNENASNEASYDQYNPSCGDSTLPALVFAARWDWGVESESRCHRTAGIRA